MVGINQNYLEFLTFPFACKLKIIRFLILIIRPKKIRHITLINNARQMCGDLFIARLRRGDATAENYNGGYLLSPSGLKFCDKTGT